MKLRMLFTKLNNAIRPAHVKAQEPTYDPVDGRVIAEAGLVPGSPGPQGPLGGTPVSGWVPSQQDEKPK
jgi:hypothetical protein